MRPPILARSVVIAAAVGLGALVAGAPARAADEVAVPLPVQARLLVRAAGYDRRLEARAGGDVRIWILFKAGHAHSELTAEQMLRALAGEPLVAGLQHHELLVPVTTFARTVERVNAERPSILYVSPGFGPHEIAQLVEALGEASVLTVASAAGDVSAGLALGFDLVSGRPRLQVHLRHARRQGVDFDADFLALAQVFQ